MRGVVHQATRDPEEIGLIFREIKDEFRRCLAREGRSITKKLRWKIEASADTPTQSRLVSLFLDPVMREFMQRLVFTVESLRVELPTRPEQQKVRQIFERISNKEQTQNAEDEARHLLNREQCLSRFTGKFARPQPLLLEGETGVGKTVIAEWLYRRLARSDRQMSFQRISTVNLGVNFLEAELFGTVAGAWTGSVTRPGKLLLGYGGVVFLDEIGELAPEVQAKFLVYLDTFEFTPDGWPYDWPIWAPSYIVAATNKDLKQAVGAGAFRRDLYHRFTHKLRVPALRERRHDLRPLIDLVLQNPAINNNYVDEISLAALGRLEAYDFPGNFRELEAILARTVFRTRQMGRRVIQEEDVEFNLI
jgi:transcriptional regulator with GAF, ATPase, and Fis domain